MRSACDGHRAYTVKHLPCCTIFGIFHTVPLDAPFSTLPSLTWLLNAWLSQSVGSEHNHDHIKGYFPVSLALLVSGKDWVPKNCVGW